MQTAMFTSVCLWLQKRVNISEYMLLLRRLYPRAGDTTRRIWCLPRALSPGGCGAEKVQVRIGGERIFDSGGHVELLPMEGERYGRYRCAPFELIDTIQNQVTRANV